MENPAPIADSVTMPGLTLPCDAEHTGIRLAGCTTFLFTLVASFVLTLSILPDAALLAVFVSLITAGGLAFVLDRILHRVWPSGRKLQADAEHIVLLQHGREEDRIQAQEHVNVLLWYFEVQRNSRVRKGWYVIACGLEQDDGLLVIYSFAPPTDFEQLPLAASFSKLSRKSSGNPLKSERELRLAGEQRRLHDAERYRGEYGAELAWPQFQEYLSYLSEHYPQWMVR